METLLGMELIDWEDFFKLASRLIFNFIVLFLIVRLLYYPATRRKDYLFTYFMIGTTVFFLSFLLESVKIQLGFALGLFAVFGILRYRTLQIPIKEMTYLFIVIGVSIINALANKKISFGELVLTNAVIILFTYILEKRSILRHEYRKTIRYEKLELIKPEHRAALIQDLEERTGLRINRIEIGNINFLRDTARITIFYYEDASQ